MCLIPPVSRATIDKERCDRKNSTRGCSTDGDVRTPYDDSVDEDEVIIAELDSRLPDTDLKTCSDFAHLSVNCCETCHKFYPEYEMSVIRLPDGGTAWVCDPVKDAVNGTIAK